MKQAIALRHVAFKDLDGLAVPLAAAGYALLYREASTDDLAATTRTPNQAFALARHGLALQFHIETTEKGLERWYVGHTLEIAATPGTDVATLRADVARHAGRPVAAGHRLVASWLAGLDAPEARG
jgi:hypothetical protein